MTSNKNIIINIYFLYSFFLPSLFDKTINSSFINFMGILSPTIYIPYVIFKANNFTKIAVTLVSLLV